MAGCYNEGSFLLLLREFLLHACQYAGDFFCLCAFCFCGVGCILLAHFFMESAQARDGVPIIRVYRFQIETLAGWYVEIAI
ncbi:hypothetical protein DZC30_11085 [Comamonas testosteroni]|uniref:Uncharacterized protein n=1 Tax=Comamonas testosteroni TaxID=285 RepID=A0A373FLY2_COMTE|nr:hypothetical protein DZC30_11085 [Comamonas testosteroni]